MGDAGETLGLARMCGVSWAWTIVGFGCRVQARCSRDWGLTVQHATKGWLAGMHGCLDNGRCRLGRRHGVVQCEAWRSKDMRVGMTSVSICLGACSKGTALTRAWQGAGAHDEMHACGSWAWTWCVKGAGIQDSSALGGCQLACCGGWVRQWCG